MVTVPAQVPVFVTVPVLFSVHPIPSQQYVWRHHETIWVTSHDYITHLTHGHTSEVLVV
jgi:hypothetical protein